jgi:hypothetical protein
MTTSRYTVNKKTSPIRMMHSADMVIAITREIDEPKKRIVKILKNRYGPHGNVTLQTTINVCCRMIAMSIFGGKSLKLFRVELEELIKETIMKKIGDIHDPFQ